MSCIQDTIYQFRARYFWSSLGSLHFHKGSQGNGNLFMSPFDSDSLISGRLAPPGKDTRGAAASYRDGPKACQIIRDSDKSGQVTPHTSSVFRTPRSPPRLGPRSGFPHKPSRSQGSALGNLSKELQESDCQGLSVVPGAFQFHFGFHPPLALHVRPLQFYLKCFYVPHRDPLEAVIPLTPIFFKSLEWWESEDNLLAGILCIPRTLN